MAKVPKELFQPKSMGATEAALEGIKEGVSALLSTAKDVGGAVWDGAKPLFDHGRSEAAACLFGGNGSGYVMYQRGVQGIEQGQDQPLHGPEVQPPEIEQERGGMSM